MSERKIFRQGNSDALEQKPIVKKTTMNLRQKKGRFNYRNLLLGFGFSGIAIFSMVIGALLALSLSENTSTTS